MSYNTYNQNLQNLLPATASLAAKTVSTEVSRFVTAETIASTGTFVSVTATDEDRAIYIKNAFNKEAIRKIKKFLAVHYYNKEGQNLNVAEDLDGADFFETAMSGKIYRRPQT